jgi:hypothetical protein
MAINVNLSGLELAQHLAQHLSDVEFELLVRERIKNLFRNVHGELPNLSESYNACSFIMSWSDESKWRVGIGENYSKSADVEGQVLSRCVADVMRIYEMKQGNKLSLLLPAPKPVVWEEDPN